MSLEKALADLLGGGGLAFFLDTQKPTPKTLMRNSCPRLPKASKLSRLRRSCPVSLALLSPFKSLFAIPFANH